MYVCIQDASPTFIAVPQITQISLVNISQGNQQLHESVGNVRVSLEGGALNGAITINPPLAAQVPGHWSTATIATQKERVIEAALACWPV
jgi:hypothetical protein